VSELCPFIRERVLPRLHDGPVLIGGLVRTRKTCSRFLPEGFVGRGARVEINGSAKMDPEKEHEEEITLKPKMTLLNGITVIVGSIIGSGIFVSPSGVLKNTGSVNVSLLVWTISGIFSMVSSF